MATYSDHTYSTGLSFGGDVPTWEGDVTVNVELRHDDGHTEIEGTRVETVDGKPVAECCPRLLELIKDALEGGDHDDAMLELADEYDAEATAADERNDLARDDPE